MEDDPSIAEEVVTEQAEVVEGEQAPDPDQDYATAFREAALEAEKAEGQGEGAPGDEKAAGSPTETEKADVPDEVKAALELAEKSFGGDNKPKEEAAPVAPPRLSVDALTPAGANGRYTKEQVKVFSDLFPVNAMPETIMVGDKEVNVEEAFENLPEIISLMRLVAGQATATALEAMKASSGPAQQSQAEKIAALEAQVEYNEYLHRLSSGFETTDAEGKPKWVEGVPEAYLLVRTRGFNKWVEEQSDAFKLMVGPTGTPEQHLVAVKAYKAHLGAIQKKAVTDKARTQRDTRVSVSSSRINAGTGDSPARPKRGKGDPEQEYRSVWREEAAKADRGRAA